MHVAERRAVVAHRVVEVVTLVGHADRVVDEDAVGGETTACASQQSDRGSPTLDPRTGAFLDASDVF